LTMSMGRVPAVGVVLEIAPMAAIMAEVALGRAVKRIGTLIGTDVAAPLATW